jgi:hypothetical protein
MIQSRNPRILLFWKWFGTEFRGFSHPKMVRSGIPRVFLFREIVQNGIPKFFSSEKWFGMEFRGFFSSEKWFGTEFWGFSLLRNGSEWNSEGFPLLRNGSERNSEVFLFRKTGGIPMELPSFPSCSVFRGIIFLSENGNPSTDGDSLTDLRLYTSTKLKIVNC